MTRKRAPGQVNHSKSTRTYKAHLSAIMRTRAGSALRHLAAAHLRDQSWIRLMVWGQLLSLWDMADKLGIDHQLTDDLRRSANAVEAYEVYRLQHQARTAAGARL